MEAKSIQRIDSNMEGNKPKSGGQIKWYAPDEAPFRLNGFLYYKKDKLYRRLPIDTKEMFCRVNNNLNLLSENTAGGQIAFRTNSERILIRVKLQYKHDMVNMAATGQCGFDCYIGRNGERLKFCGVSRFDIEEEEYECELASGLPMETIQEVLIHFPLYCGVKEVLIGLEEEAAVEPPKEFDLSGKLVFYGTSITQGGCASRPGMAYTNILSRWLNAECINFGFSANGLGEYEMAHMIAEIKDIAMVVLDYEANAGTNGRLEASLEGFLAIIREKHPHIPVLIVSRIPYLADFYDKDLLARRDELREFQRRTAAKRRAGGDRQIYFANGHELVDEGFDEYTVDSIHPTDLGFYKMSESLYRIMKKILFGGNDNEAIFGGVQQ